MILCKGSRTEPHEEICIEDRATCPACEALDSLRAVERKITDLENEIGER